MVLKSTTSSSESIGIVVVCFILEFEFIYYFLPKITGTLISTHLSGQQKNKKELRDLEGKPSLRVNV